MQSKYLNPFTDFGFKKIFGEEASKPLLIDFLNSLLPDINIVDLTFKDKEKIGNSESDRKAVYDIYCENQAGEKIIIELQKAKQNYFKERTIFYASFPIQEQANRGDWDFNLRAVYCIGILDFKFDEDKISKGEVIHIVELKDQNHQVFYDKLKFVYIEMPHFNKAINQLVTRLDKWLYFIKHLEEFDQIPEIFKDQIFNEAFQKAALDKLTQKERLTYEDNLKVYRDYKNTIDTAYQQGLNEGINEGINQGINQGILLVAKKLKENGVANDIIIQTTGLTLIQIENL